MKYKMLRKSQTLNSALLLIIVLMLACSDEARPVLCTTCPEVDQAYVVAQNYIDRNKAEIGLRDKNDELLPYTFFEDRYGNRFIRYYQYYHGVRVIGGEIIVYMNVNLTVTGFGGRLVLDVERETRPTINSNRAVKVAEEHFGNIGYTGSLEGDGELVVLRWLKVDHLCWRYTLRTSNSADLIEYYIDADSGGIVTWRSLLIYD